MEPQDKETQGEARVGQLIAAAGPGQTASPAARQRVYAAVRAHWEATAGPRAAAARQERAATRRRFSRLRTLGIAAGLSAAAVLIYSIQGVSPETGEAGRFAQLLRIEGGAELLRAGTTVPLGSSTGPQWLEAGDRLRTGPDGRLALELGAGAALRINVDSDLVFADAGSIELAAGAVYIDSGEDGSAAALDVQTPLGRVAHTGTQYEVQVNAARLLVRVREGAIAYSGAGGIQTGIAGEELSFDRSGLTGRSEIAADAETWSWAVELATLPVAAEHDLLETLTWAARESGLVIGFADPAIADRRAGEPLNGLSGYNPAEVLRVLPDVSSVRFRIADGRLTVLE